MIEPASEPMISPGMRLCFTLSGAAFATALVYGWVTAADAGWFPIGPLSVGLAGPVGDHVGYGILMAISLGALLLGVMLSFVRDVPVPSVGGPQTDSAPVPTEAVVGRPTRRPPWPLAVVSGLALVVVGVALDRYLVLLGLGVVAATGVGWLESARREQLARLPPERRPDPPPPDPLGEAIRTSRWGIPLARATSYLVIVIGILVLFASLSTRSGNTLLGLFVLGLAVILTAGVEAAIHRPSAPASPDDRRLSPTPPAGPQ